MYWRYRSYPIYGRNWYTCIGVYMRLITRCTLCPQNSLYRRIPVESTVYGTGALHIRQIDRNRTLMYLALYRSCPIQARVWDTAGPARLLRTSILVQTTQFTRPMVVSPQSCRFHLILSVYYLRLPAALVRAPYMAAEVLCAAYGPVPVSLSVCVCVGGDLVR